MTGEAGLSGFQGWTNTPRNRTALNRLVLDYERAISDAIVGQVNPFPYLVNGHARFFSRKSCLCKITFTRRINEDTTDVIFY